MGSLAPGVSDEQEIDVQWGIWGTVYLIEATSDQATSLN